MALRMSFLHLLLLALQVFLAATKEDSGGGEAEKWKKKDVRDYTDADIERLYEQWEVNNPVHGCSRRPLGLSKLA